MLIALLVIIISVVNPKAPDMRLTVFLVLWVDAPAERSKIPTRNSMAPISLT
jgi:hypothetical protein